MADHKAADHKAAHETEQETPKTAEPHAEPKEEVPDTPDTIVTRIEANVAKMHTASPSGTEAIQAELTADLEKLRATAEAPPPEAGRKAKGADDDDEEEQGTGEKHGRGKRK